jgi:hypothetical protein
MVNIENIYKRALADYILPAGDDLGVARPHQVELGAIGLKDMPLSLQQPVKGWERIYENEFNFGEYYTTQGWGTSGVRSKSFSTSYMAGVTG